MTAFVSIGAEVTPDRSKVNGHGADRHVLRPARPVGASPLERLRDDQERRAGPCTGSGPGPRACSTPRSSAWRRPGAGAGRSEPGDARPRAGSIVHSISDAGRAGTAAWLADPQVGGSAITGSSRCCGSAPCAVRHGGGSSCARSIWAHDQADGLRPPGRWSPPSSWRAAPVPGPGPHPGPAVRLPVELRAHDVPVGERHSPRCDEGRAPAPGTRLAVQSPREPSDQSPAVPDAGPWGGGAARCRSARASR